MKNDHWLSIAVLVLAAASVDLVIARATWGLQFPHPAIAGLLAFGLAQLGLIAAWLATGPGNIVVRVGLAVLAMSFFAWLLSSTTRPDFTQWLGVLGLYVTVVTVPIFIFHWVVIGRPRGAVSGDARPPGNRGSSGDQSTSDRSVAGSERERDSSNRQWTLAGIMSLITVVAFALGYGRLVNFPQDEAEMVIVTCIGFALTTLVSLFVAFGIKNTRWHVPAIVLTCPLIGAAFGLMLGSAAYVGVMAVVALIQSLALLLLIHLVRLPQRVPPP